jgi:hypothetical protein
VNAKQFVVAVVPVVLADFALDLAQQYLANHFDITWVSWALVTIPFLVLPCWAGARVARRGGQWQLWCLGGVCVFIGAVVLIVLSEVYDSAELEFPFAMVLTALSVMFPIYVLFGFLGGKVFAQGNTHGA